jgi:hypothetical protein
MCFPLKFKPKFNFKSITIPEISIQSKEDFIFHINKNTPFILNVDLSQNLSEISKDIEKVDNDCLINTYDSIPYSEIREGYFLDYLNYVFSDSCEKKYPKNFNLIEKREGYDSNEEFRHYALSLNQDMFPSISNFKIPFLSDENYLLQLTQTFFKENNITSPHWLFIHPKYSVSNAHYDHDCVHTVIFQIKGSKKIYLVSPEFHEYIRNVNFPLLPNGFNDFTDEKLENLPTENLSVWEGDLNENQLIFIPKKWVHFVVGITSGISYSQDIVLKDNFNEWMDSIFSKRVI